MIYQKKTKSVIVAELDEAKKQLGKLKDSENECNRIKDALHLSEANQAAIIENALNSIWAINTRYEILYTNQVFKQAFLATFGEAIVVDSNLLKALPESIRPAWKERSDLAFDGERFDFVDQIEDGD